MSAEQSRAQASTTHHMVGVCPRKTASQMNSLQTVERGGRQNWAEKSFNGAVILAKASAHKSSWPVTLATM